MTMEEQCRRAAARMREIFGLSSDFRQIWRIKNLLLNLRHQSGARGAEKDPPFTP